MKINIVLECFNRALDDNNKNNKCHFVAHSFWERKIGSIKSATTIITLHDPIEGNKEIIKEEYIGRGDEQVVVEESQKKALTEFVKLWSNDTGIK